MYIKSCYANHIFKVFGNGYVLKSLLPSLLQIQVVMICLLFCASAASENGSLLDCVQKIKSCTTGSKFVPFKGDPK